MTGREVIQGLASVHEAPEVKERRRARRENWPIYVTVSWDEEAGREAVDAIAYHMSETGLCFFAQQFPLAGRVVIVRFNELPGQPKLEGRVRHTRRIGGPLHRIGVEFSS